MSSTSTRKGGCGCGGHSRTYNGNGHGHGNGNGNGNGGCGCRSSQPCGCDDRVREVLGDCRCEGPVRCGVPCLERPAYSAGQLLTADSLRLGQNYFEDRFALRRFIDGVGVVCGLHVRCDPDENGWIIVDPGYGVDCCGHDIVLCEPVRFNVCRAIDSCPKPAEPCDPIVEQPPAPPPPDDKPDELPPITSGNRYTSSIIEGTVTDEAGAPIDGAAVLLVGASLGMTTAPDGTYSIGTGGPGIPPGTYEVRCAKMEYRFAYRMVTVQSATRYRVDFTLKRSNTPVSSATSLEQLADRFLTERLQNESDALKRLAEPFVPIYRIYVFLGRESFANQVINNVLTRLTDYWVTQKNIPQQQADAWAARVRELARSTTSTPAPAPQAAPAAQTYRTYVLTVERTWEGRAPVPVVLNRAGCDSRPECKPSKEMASVRLCVTPLDESSTASRVRDRTQRFREVGVKLIDRVARALEVAGGITADAIKDPNPGGRVIAEALLSMLREEPAVSSCNLYDLICDIRRLVMGDAPRCFTFPSEVSADKERALVGIFGQLLDDFREAYLTLGCDDCCEQVGIRLAHVITQDLLPECAPRKCSIAAIDTHVPAREALHPRSAWWYPDQVSVFDAYFRGIREAGVLLTDRGLTVEVREANTNTTTPTLDTRVRDWISAHAGAGELARLALYQNSILYADYGSTVVLWTVGGRVVAITTDVSKRSTIVTKSVGNRINYLRYSISPPLARVTPIVEFAREEFEFARQPTPAPAAAPAEAAVQPDTGRMLETMDPAPFKELLDRVGRKTETSLYERGITTLKQLADAPDLELAELMRFDDIQSVKAQARSLLQGKSRFERDKLAQWEAAARVRKAKLERSPA